MLRGGGIALPGSNGKTRKNCRNNTPWGQLKIDLFLRGGGRGGKGELLRASLKKKRGKVVGGIDSSYSQNKKHRKCRINKLLFRSEREKGEPLLRHKWEDRHTRRLKRG